MTQMMKKKFTKASFCKLASLGSRPYNLVNSGNLEKYYQLLSDFQFMSDKINHPELGIEVLIADYNLIDAPELLENLEYNPEKVKTLKLIQGALQLSGHVVNQDKNQLAGQLWGRMQGLRVPEIQGLLVKAEQNKTSCLRPLTPSLTPPGGALLRTFIGLSDWSEVNLYGSAYSSYHEVASSAVAVTLDGKYAISGSENNTLKLWHLKTGELARTFSGHSSWVRAVAVTPDGKYAISGSDDRTLKLWHLETGEEVYTFTGHSSWVRAVAVTPDGKYAISGSDDNTLKLWHLQTGEEVYTFTGHKSEVWAVAVTPDGKYAISALADKTLKLWHLETGELARTFSGHSSTVTAVAVTPDGKYTISGSDDRTLKLWHLETGELVHTFTGHSSRVRAVAVTPDGKYTISGSDDKTLKLWHLETGELVHTFTGHSRSVMAVAVAPDGKYAISGSKDDTFKLWYLKTGAEAKTFSGHSEIVVAVAVTSDSKYAISASYDKTLKLWHLGTGELLRTFTGHSDVVRAVAVTPDGKYAISASNDKTLKLWHLETGELARTFRSHRHAAFTHRDIVTDVAVAPDGKYAISASKDKTLKLWHLETGKLVHTFTGDSKEVRAVAVTPDGKYAIFGSFYDSFDSTLKLWHLQTGKLARTFSGHSDVMAVAVTPDGKYAIPVGDKTLKLWHLETGKLVHTFTGHSEVVSAVAFTPDGKYAISASKDKTLKLWHLETGMLVHTFTGHSAWVIDVAVAVTPDGKYAISGSHDNTLKVWDFLSGEEIASFTGESSLGCFAVAPDGRTIIAGEVSGRVHFLRLKIPQEKLAKSEKSALLFENFTSKNKALTALITEQEININQKRIEDYANLIKRLINCSRGQEWEILNTYPELLDQGLVTTMEQAAVVMKDRGDQKAADFLQDLAAKLSKMGDHFTNKVLTAIKLAREEARRLGHNFVGTEQILLGLIGEATGVAAKVLKSMGVNLKYAQIEVEKIIGRGSDVVVGEIPFTPKAKRVLKLSLEEACKLGHNKIGAEHLLLGLLQECEEEEGEEVAVIVLTNCGVELPKLRTEIFKILQLRKFLTEQTRLFGT